MWLGGGGESRTREGNSKGPWALTDFSLELLVVIEPWLGLDVMGRTLHRGEQDETDPSSSNHKEDASTVTGTPSRAALSILLLIPGCPHLVGSVGPPLALTA